MKEEIRALGTTWTITGYINPMGTYGPDGYIYEDKDHDFMPVEVPPIDEVAISHWIEENAVRRPKK